MKFGKFILAFLIIAFIGGILLRRGIDISVEVKGDLNIDSQIQVEISVTKNGKPYSPDSLRVETMNKYNNDDSLETDLLPYVTGEYLFIFTPNYAGDYFININVSDDVINYNKVETITIK